MSTIQQVVVRPRNHDGAGVPSATSEPAPEAPQPVTIARAVVPAMGEE